jgi:hypothetical protein
VSPRPLLLLACLGACAQPETVPPPQSPAAAASAPAPAPTALDLMAAHASDLALRPEQVAKLKALGKELEATNGPLEQSLAKLAPEHPQAESTSDTPPPARTRGGGGRGGAFRGGRRGGMGGGGRGRRPPPASTSPPTTARPHSDQAQAVRAQMAENHAAAVARAFSVLDNTQQEKASRLLDENDFEPPTVESVQQSGESAAPKHAVTAP